MERVAPALTVHELLRMPADELDAVFRSAPAGPIPHGTARGTMLLATGHRAGQVVRALTRRLLWRGKVFLPNGTLLNVVGPFGAKAVRATVQPAASWVDGRECVLIDYATTSTVARWVRDEIRLVGPDLYLGVAWLARRRVASFALTFESGAAS
jgi:hypothetical protein